MAQAPLHFHGSDLEKIEVAYGIKKDTIINFSSNVNPLGLSERIKEYLPQKIELIASYPDPEYTSLRESIGNYVKVDPKNILVGNGSTELISLCIKAIKPKKAFILGPTYSEYEKEVTLIGGTSTYYPLLEKDNFQLDIGALIDALPLDLDLLIMCNPNNPTSTSVNSKEIEFILKACQEKNIFVLIDETYVEFSEDLLHVTSVHLAQQYKNIMVIRGVSKFFSAPGLRLGYAICSDTNHLEQINRLKNPWTINALAAFAGELMLTDQDYIEATTAYMSIERKKIINALSPWRSVKIYPPTANFILVKLLNKEMNAHDLFEKLLHQHMMIRDASSFAFLDEYFFRFCFLKADQNDQLLKALGTLLE